MKYRMEAETTSVPCPDIPPCGWKHYELGRVRAWFYGVRVPVWFVKRLLKVIGQAA